MKIIHVIDYFQPKLGYQETFLAKEHARMGHEVSVVTSDRYHPIVYSGNAARVVMGDRIRGSGFLVEEGIKVWRLRTLFEFPHAIWLRGLESKLRELKPDLVIMHGVANLSTLRVARLKKRQGNFKLVIDDHMTFQASRSGLRVLYPLFKLAFSSLIQEAADALVGVSNTSKAFMHRRYGIPLERIAMIPLGADDELFRFDSDARREVREQLSIPGDAIIFIYAGKVVPEKSPHLLAEAAVKLMAKYENLRVVLVGNGSPPYIGQIRQSIKEAGMESRFAWHNAVPNAELPRFYSAADVAVWPREASLSMMEANACNLPVIISDSSEVMERVAHNNGITYRGDDPADLARQMEKLIDSKLRSEIGANGREFVEAELNWRTIAQRFIELCFSGGKV